MSRQIKRQQNRGPFHLTKCLRPSGQKNLKLLRAHTLGASSDPGSAMICPLGQVVVPPLLALIRTAHTLLLDLVRGALDVTSNLPLLVAGPVMVLKLM